MRRSAKALAPLASAAQRNTGAPHSYSHPPYHLDRSLSQSLSTRTDLRVGPGPSLTLCARCACAHAQWTAAGRRTDGVDWDDSTGSGGCGASGAHAVGRDGCTALPARSERAEVSRPGRCMCCGTRMQSHLADTHMPCNQAAIPAAPRVSCRAGRSSEPSRETRARLSDGQGKCAIKHTPSRAHCEKTLTRGRRL